MHVPYWKFKTYPVLGLEEGPLYKKVVCKQEAQFLPRSVECLMSSWHDIWPSYEKEKGLLHIANCLGLQRPPNKSRNRCVKMLYLALCLAPVRRPQNRWREESYIFERSLEWGFVSYQFRRDCKRFSMTLNFFFFIFYPLKYSFSNFFSMEI